MKFNLSVTTSMRSLLIAAMLLNISYAMGSTPWNQFRGNLRTGKVNINDSVMKWVEPELLWSKEVGSGFSEVVVYENVLYLMMSEKTDSISGWETMVAMDTHGGGELWRTRIDSVFIDVDGWGDGPRSTPAVDQNTIYCISASGKLTALSRASGALVWQVDFRSLYGSTRPRWGYSTSPLLVDDLVVAEVGGENNHGFAAFNKSTGALVWNNGNVLSHYNSPVLVEVQGMRQIVFTGTGSLFAFNVQGDSLWTFPMPLRSPMALPLFIEPDLLFVSAANDVGSFIIRLGADGVEQVMTSTQMRNDWSSSCYRDGFIYGFNVATLQCMDATTGERKWLKRGLGKGSLVMVADRLYVLSDMGSISVVQATPGEYKELASLNALQGRSWTAPSYAEGKLYVRNHEKIACFRIAE